MIAGSAERIICLYYTLKDFCEVFSGGINDCCVIKSRTVSRSRRSPFAVPSVERNVMMITAGRKKHRLIPIGSCYFESQKITVKSKRTIKIGNFQMYMSDLRIWRNDVIFHGIFLLK